jgi:hypothetical protein
MIVGNLPPGELAQRLAGAGLRLRTGPVVNRIQSRLPEIVQGVAFHYGDHSIEDSAGFADFHVRVAPPRSLRRWVKPQVYFQFDGASPFFPLPANQAFAMLEWGLNWCVSHHCHQYLILHSACVERSGRALLLPGPPGTGKSTMCAALASRGWRLLSDELALLDLVTANVIPLPRPISLKNASIAAIGRFVPDAKLGPPVHDTVKGSVAHMRPPADSVRRAEEHARPRWIAMPRYQSGAHPRLAPLAKARAFMHLADHAFNYDVHGRRGFELLAQVVDNSDCYDFQYAALEDAVAVFDDIARQA